MLHKSPGQALRALHRRQDALCALCGTTINGETSKRYCSNACRCKAWRKRKVRIGTLAGAPSLTGGP